MDEPDRIPPEYHLFTRSRINWLHVDDDLPGYEEFKD